MNIGKYEIRGRLGRGGMGVVYKAAMPLTGKIVALKVCRPAEIMLDLMGEDAVRELFLSEAIAMADIRHPHIASVLDVGEADMPDYREDSDGGTLTMPFFAMEYYCTDLGQVMGEGYEVERASRIIPPDDALEYARQMLEGLRRLHFSELVHRDVKPFNVMLTDEDEVKLIDFGLSRRRGERPGNGPGSPKGMVVGSPYYTAPEQEQDADAADERADLFSVGVTLFRMLTGLLPVTEAGEPRSVMSVYESMGDSLGWCPDAVWDEFLDKAMAPDPDQRFQSAGAMLQGLDELASHWERARAEACAWIEPDGDDEAGAVIGKPGPPRSTPLKIRKKNARRTFGLDELWRPLEHAPIIFSGKGEVVHDAARGLVWQRSGSAYPLTHEDGQEYVENLCENEYQGYNEWRLPTVDELLGLLARPDHAAAMCMPDLFDPVQRRLWAADRKAFNAAWYVNARKGFVWWQDTTCRFYVRAVCSERK